jgi:maltose alpha-D-glucosyltransferase/alpha-amylase
MEASVWYRDAVIYELHVRAFADSNGDGIGDLRGLISKLDYLQDLGITAVWLLPFYPSPLRDDGYDIAQYKGIHPAYGVLRDFRVLLREARRRGLKIITELVLNHTSDQHPWFQRARRAKPGTTHRDYYVWSDTPDRYRDARIIFKDFESSNWTWDPVAQAYYWHRFYSHQPDLNYDNPDVRKAMLRAMDFWLDLGVDGLRLDAVPYLFEREGTNCENLPETYLFLEEIRRHVEQRYEDRMLLAEANQWPEDAAAYFGEGNRCHMAFHFPLMPRMFMATRMEDRFPVVDILAQTPGIPENCQWALFLRNHDELTLEMVTDEERDYMYRVYAEDPQARINLGIRRRLAPLLGNNRRLMEMLNGLLLSLPGTPVIYYGDEIGMGDNIYLGDRNGVRTPMQWSADRNAGFSQANPQKLYLPVIIDPEYHAAAFNVEAQQNNPHSLLWFMKRIIALRKRYRAFGRGSLEFLYPENRKVLAFIRRHGEERILVVANLSRMAQYVELDLSEYRGMVPVELFGQTEFPSIGELPYLLTLGPYAFYWFSLETQPVAALPAEEMEFGLPVIEVDGRWDRVFTGPERGALEEVLPGYLRSRRWFGARARKIKTAEIVEAIALPAPRSEASDGSSPKPAGYLLLTHVEYSEGDPDTYALTVAATPPADPGESHQSPPLSALARLNTEDGERVLFDAVWEEPFAGALLDAIARRRRLGGLAGQILASPTRAFREAGGSSDAGALRPSVWEGEQTNTSIVYGDRLLLKLFRRLEEGDNPDLEIGRFLTEKASFSNMPPVAGWLEYRKGRAAGRPMALGILQRFVPNEGDAWQYTLDSLGNYLERALAQPPDEREPPLPRRAALLDLSGADPPRLAQDTIGHYLESARLLGQRTAELHRALGSAPDDPHFAPEAITPHHQRAMYQSMRALAGQVYRLIGGHTTQIPQLVQVADLQEAVLARFRRLLEGTIEAKRIRCHGDYHLGQVLYTGRDFLIIDFEGEPARPLSERRIKRTPLRDVTGMIRSFHYAAYAALLAQMKGPAGPSNSAYLQPWALFWYLWVSATFLRSYLAEAGPAGLLPKDRRQLEIMMDALLLEKALYELRYEINHRPDWVRIPIEGILQLLEASD